MHNLTPLSPLGHTEPLIETIGEITLIEEVGFALASCAARLGTEKQTKTALKTFLNAPAPDVSKAVTSGELSAFWMGPDFWMIEAPFETHEDLAAQLKDITKDNASITEQTDGWCRFDLKGTTLANIFERLCMINMRKMQTGDATRTSIEHLGCFVIMRDKAHVSVLGPRSSAASLHHALVTAIYSVR